MQQSMTRVGSVAARKGCKSLATKSFSVSVAHLLGQRAQRFESVTPCTRVLDAVDRMASNNVGSLIVLEDGRLEGIVTERDVLLGTPRLHARAQQDDAPLLVSDIMTRDPVTVRATATVGDCLSIMTDDGNRFRHLPVVDGGELVGVLSIRDLCDQITEDHRDEVAQLSTQVNKLAALVAEDLRKLSGRSGWYLRFCNMVALR